MLLQPAELRAQRLLPRVPGWKVSTGQLGQGDGGRERFDEVVVGSGVCRVITAVRVQYSSEACVGEEVGRKITVVRCYTREVTDSCAVSTSKRVCWEGGGLRTCWKNRGSLVKPSAKGLFGD